MLDASHLIEPGLLVTYYKPHTPRSLPKPWSKKGKKPRNTTAQKKKHLADLLTTPVPQLFQNNPDKKAFGFYRPSGYTRSIEGSCKSGRRRVKVVLTNNRMVRRRLTHLVNINLLEPRHPEFINRDFKAFVKALEKREVAAQWTIHIDRKNIVHWHLVFQNYQGKAQSLKTLVQRCLNEVETFPKRRVYADKIRNQRQKLEYILRVKKSGHGEAYDHFDKTSPRRSPVRDDIYANDRILFKSNTGLAKNGTVGDFWAKQPNGKPYSEKTLWQLIRTQTNTVEENFTNPRLKKEVEHLHGYFGIPLARAKWAVCLDPSPYLPRSGLHRSRVRPSRPSSGLVSAVFSSRQRRHGIPVRSMAIEIGQIGSPPATHGVGLQERLKATCEGLLRDTKGRQGMGCFWDVLSASRSWIGMVLGLFRKKQLRNSVRKTFGLGP